MAKSKKSICLISSKKIKLFAKDRRLRLEDIANHLGIKERALYNKLSYNSSFSDTEIVILTSLFKCSRSDLCKEHYELSQEEKEFYKDYNIKNLS